MIELFTRTALKKGYDPEGLPINLEEFPVEVRRRLNSLYAQIYHQGMNIFALKNDKVIFLGNERGRDYKDKENASLHLKKGEVYTVNTTFVSDCYSYVHLKEAPNTVFNSMFFENGFIN